MVPYFKIQDQDSCRIDKTDPFGAEHFTRASCIVTLRAGGDEDSQAEVKPPQLHLKLPLLS